MNLAGDSAPKKGLDRGAQVIIICISKDAPLSSLPFVLRQMRVSAGIRNEAEEGASARRII